MKTLACAGYSYQRRKLAARAVCIAGLDQKFVIG
jgi:hypothetical protein